MVHKRKHKMICLVLAAVLLAGIYLDIVAADTFFLRSPAEEAVLCSRSLHTVINNLEICGSGLPDGYGGVRQQLQGLYAYLSLLSWNRVFTLLDNTPCRLGTLQSFCQTLDGLVMDYMHQSDGKKRSETNSVIYI